jgi:hypothetical protein
MLTSVWQHFVNVTHISRVVNTVNLTNLSEAHFGNQVLHGFVIGVSIDADALNLGVFVNHVVDNGFE